MLKITTQIEGNAVQIALDGKLAGPWVKELEGSWRAASGASSMRTVSVNLSDVTFVDQEGKELLAMMYRNGVELAATGCLNRCIMEEIINSEGKKS